VSEIILLVLFIGATIKAIVLVTILILLLSLIATLLKPSTNILYKFPRDSDKDDGVDSDDDGDLDFDDNVTSDDDSILSTLLVY